MTRGFGDPQLQRKESSVQIYAGFPLTGCVQLSRALKWSSGICVNLLSSKTNLWQLPKHLPFAKDLSHPYLLHKFVIFLCMMNPLAGFGCRFSTSTTRSSTPHFDGWSAGSFPGKSLWNGTYFSCIEKRGSTNPRYWLWRIGKSFWTEFPFVEGNAFKMFVSQLGYLQQCCTFQCVAVQNRFHRVTQKSGYDRFSTEPLRFVVHTIPHPAALFFCDPSVWSLCQTSCDFWARWIALLDLNQCPLRIGIVLYTDPPEQVLRQPWLRSRAPVYSYVHPSESLMKGWRSHGLFKPGQIIPKIFLRKRAAQ